MKFSAAIVSAAVALASTSTSYAFTAQRSVVRSARGFPPLASTKEETAVASTKDSAAEKVAANAAANSLNDTASTIPPEFTAARDKVVGGLKATLPLPALEQPLEHFVTEYFTSLGTAAAAGNKNKDGSDITAEQAVNYMMRTLGFGFKYGLGKSEKGKFTFDDVRWKALRAEENDERYQNEELQAILGDDIGTNFYAAGCDFFRPSIDLENSLVLGKDNLEKARKQIEAGENVVFLANHQSEADPQVVSVLLESVSDEAGALAAQVTYVAGHKVTTDPLAVPFSMGRNLLCIHSKKHIDTDPETKPAKSKQNMAAMNSMLTGLKEGGMAIWVAPSGGRDRRDVDSGKIPIAPFDQKTVDMFRLMGRKSKTPTHFYPMSMVSYDLCPPPDFVEAGVGEQRNVRFTPIGIAVCDEVPNVGGAEKRHLFTELAEEECQKGYEELLKGMGMERYIP